MTDSDHPRSAIVERLRRAASLGEGHGCVIADGAADEIEALRQILRLFDEHLGYEIQFIPWTPELAEVYDRAVPERSGS